MIVGRTSGENSQSSHRANALVNAPDASFSPAIVNRMPTMPATTPKATGTSGTQRNAAAATSAAPVNRSGRRQPYARAVADDFQMPSFSHSRCPPSTAANMAPAAPIPRPATRSTRTPASCSARSTPA